MIKNFGNKFFINSAKHIAEYLAHRFNIGLSHL